MNESKCVCMSYSVLFKVQTDEGMRWCIWGGNEKRGDDMICEAEEDIEEGGKEGWGTACGIQSENKTSSLQAIY